MSDHTAAPQHPETLEDRVSALEAAGPPMRAAASEAAAAAAKASADHQALMARVAALERAPSPATATAELDARVSALEQERPSLLAPVKEPIALSPEHVGAIVQAGLPAPTPGQPLSAAAQAALLRAGLPVPPAAAGPVTPAGLALLTQPVAAIYAFLRKQFPHERFGT
jgi:hypothetical protein